MVIWKRERSFIMVVSRFEDMAVWKMARELNVLIYKNFSSRKDFGFWNQITRAAVSVMNNISEVFESSTDKEFIRYLGYSKSSCGEVRGMIYTALDIGYIEKETQEMLLNKCRITAGAIYGLIKYLGKSKSQNV